MAYTYRNIYDFIRYHWGCNPENFIVEKFRGLISYTTFYTGVLLRTLHVWSLDGLLLLLILPKGCWSMNLGLTASTTLWHDEIALKQEMLNYLCVWSPNSPKWKSMQNNSGSDWGLETTMVHIETQRNIPRYFPELRWPHSISVTIIVTFFYILLFSLTV